jgi:hypothetical protein
MNELGYMEREIRKLQESRLEEIEPTCDICGEPDLVGEADDGHWLTPNWNGETGNHITCEEANKNAVSSVSAESEV